MSHAVMREGHTNVDATWRNVASRLINGYASAMTPTAPSTLERDLQQPPLTPDALVPYAERVFCNRNLRLDRISAIGFDMDYTLAIYEQAMETVQAEMALARMVERYRYPEAILAVRYRPDFGIRGLAVDIRNGNLFKMDSHRHVGRTWHGNRPLTRDERHALYRNRRMSPADPDVVMVDTLFSLPELCLYSQLVAILDTLSPSRPDYERLWRDLRETMDVMHRDGSLKARIAADVPRFIRRIPALPATLAAFRRSGKRLFLLTNSEPAYTDLVMRYLLDGAEVDFPDWRSYFDVVVASARKPFFFSGDHPFLEVLPDQSAGEPVSALRPGVTVVNGNYRDLARLAGMDGDEVLYVGDHLYGDILRSKRSTAWRTAMIVPEMGRELTRMQSLGPRLDELERLDQVTHQLELDHATLSRNGGLSTALHAQLEALRASFERLEVETSNHFNPYWGALFREKSELSAFGAQVETYACVYTSCVSNFLHYSPDYYFRSPRDRMAHELQR
jgi:5'-nucleotidase